MRGRAGAGANFASFRTCFTHDEGMSNDATITEALRALIAVGPLSDLYAYTPEVGAALRRSEPRLWGGYKDQDPRWRPEQADNYAFVAYLETCADVDICALAAPIIAADDVLRRELVNSLEWELTPPRRPSEVIDGDGPAVAEGVGAYIPAACVALGDIYPDVAWAAQELSRLEARPSYPAVNAQLTGVHPPRLLDDIETFAAEGGGRYDPETIVVPGTPAAIRAGAGALLRACADAMTGEIRHAMCLARPGSHHAGVERPMGTCVVNNLAVAAHWARERRYRVAIVDLDAHHGNGTQEIMRNRPDVLTISLHQAFYPGTGAPTAADHIVNLPLGGHGDLWSAWDIVGERLNEHRPDLILVEASFDALGDDVISDLGWEPQDITQMFADLAGLAPCVCEVGAAGSEAAFRNGMRAALAGLQKR